MLSAHLFSGLQSCFPRSSLKNSYAFLVSLIPVASSSLSLPPRVDDPSGDFYSLSEAIEFIGEILWGHKHKAMSRV
jgi:hypothetical protein